MKNMKNNFKEGDKVGYFTFVKRVENPLATGPNRNSYAIFICRCGKEHYSIIYHIINGTTKSCGCMTGRLVSESHTKHGHTLGRISGEYTSFYCMWYRCTSPKHKDNHRYVRNGITICDEWRHFDAFIKDMGLKPTQAHTLDRINNKKGYYKENCRWATRKEQNRNKDSTVFITLNGETKTIPEWAEITGFNLSALYMRYKLKWSPERMLLVPPRPRKKKTNS